MNNDEVSRKVLAANIEVHTRMASTYNSCEPHFRPENVATVERRLRELCHQTNARRLLDLGCGSGFIIQIAKRIVPEIVGVDATQAMLDQVDQRGSAGISLICADTGVVELPPASFDVATGYSFFHHLYDVEPTFATAFRALRPGGVLYADLEPNQMFWESVHRLPRDRPHDPIVQREIEMVALRNEGVERSYGIPRETFSYAEYGKDFLGGFREDSLTQILQKVGFRSVKFFYNWFIGQGDLINNPTTSRETALLTADAITHWLHRIDPLSRGLFKYLGFYAQK